MDQDEEEVWWEKFTHLTPRIDEDKYQCPVPEWEPEDKSTQSPPEPDESVVQWSANLLGKDDAKDTAIDEHLAFTRSVCEQAPFSWQEEGFVNLESDEQSLRHLVTHRSRDSARMSTLALLGYGREESRRRWDAKEPEKSMPRSSLDYRDRTTLRSFMYGAFEPMTDTYAYPKSSGDVEDSTMAVSTKRNCTGSKKEWQALQQECNKVMKLLSPATGKGSAKTSEGVKPKEEIVFALLDKAASLGSAEFLGDAFVDSMQKVLKELYQLASHARAWTARVHDCIAMPPPPPLPLASSGTSSSSSSAPSSTSASATAVVEYHTLILEKLQQLKEEGMNDLPLLISDKKIQGLSIMMDNIARWHNKASCIIKAIETASSSPSSSSSSSSSSSQPESRIKRASKASSNAKDSEGSDEEDLCHIYHVKCLIEEAQHQPCLKALSEYATLNAKLQDSKPLSNKLKNLLLPAKLRPENFKPMSWIQFLDLEQEVKSIGFNLSESVLFNELASKIKRWHQDALHAEEQSPDFKSLQKLIGEGESFPVEFNDILASLKKKSAKALEWVEKARNIIPHKKTRKNADTEKVQFEDMKNMLNEVSQMNVDMKEKDHMASVVETAEDWIDRVKQALNDNEESTVALLQQLVNEADSIPVSMGELKMLQCEINARRWSNSVVENLEKGAGANIDTLHKLLKDAAKIRESMPADIRSNKKSYRLEEENRLQVIVNQADNWKAKVKKLIANKQGTVEKFKQVLQEAESIPVNLSSTTKQIEAIFVKVDEWKENYANEIRFYEKALLKMKKKQNNVSSEGVNEEEGSNRMMDDGEGESGGDNNEAAVGSEEAKEVEDDDMEVPEKIDLSALEKCIITGEKTGAQFNELISMRALLDSGKKWLEKTEKLFDVAATRSKRASSSATQSTHSSGSKLSEADIKHHIQLASTLPFEFHGHVIKLENSLKYALEWQRRARVALEEDMTLHSSASFSSDYDDSISATSTPSSSPPSSSKTVREPQTNTTATHFDFDEELVERLELLLLEADAIIVNLEEEPIISSFLALYEWCQEASTTLYDTTSALSVGRGKGSNKGPQTITAQSFEKLLASGKTLLENVQSLSSHSSVFSPLTRSATVYFSIISSTQQKVASWCGVAKKAVESSNGVTLTQANDLLGAAKDFPPFEEVLKWIATLRSCHDWLSRAHHALNGTKRLDADGFTDLIEQASSLNVDSSTLKKLRSQLKQAKAWRIKVKKTGLEKGKATTSQLRELLPEANSILVDLADELDVIKMATAQHCICRKPNVDGLVTCKQCHIHYHKACLSVDASQAKEFVCTRCVLRALYAANVGAIVSTCDRWACNISPENFSNLPLVAMDPTAAAASGIDVAASGVASASEMNDIGSSPSIVTVTNPQSPPALVFDQNSPEVNRIKFTVMWFKLAREACFAQDFEAPPSLTTLPELLKTLLETATSYGIATLPDVKKVMDGLELCVWYYTASGMLWGSPPINALYQLVCRGNELSVHPAPLSTFNKLCIRAREWQTLAIGALSSFDKALVNKLRKMKDSIPVSVPEETSLIAMQEDGFKRYCLCQGPADGSFMIGCDICDCWYHGHCVGVDAQAGDKITKTNSQYICPKCSNKNGLPYEYTELMGKLPKTIEEEDDDDARYSTSMKTEWLATLWPPGRLVGEVTASSSSTRTSLSNSASQLVKIVDSSHSSSNTVGSATTTTSSASSSTYQPISSGEGSSGDNSLGSVAAPIAATAADTMTEVVPLKRNLEETESVAMNQEEGTKRMKASSPILPSDRA